MELQLFTSRSGGQPCLKRPSHHCTAGRQFATSGAELSPPLHRETITVGRGCLRLSQETITAGGIVSVSAAVRAVSATVRRQSQRGGVVSASARRQSQRSGVVSASARRQSQRGGVVSVSAAGRGCLRHSTAKLRRPLPVTIECSCDPGPVQHLSGSSRPVRGCRTPSKHHPRPRQTPTKISASPASATPRCRLAGDSLETRWRLAAVSPESQTAVEAMTGGAGRYTGSDSCVAPL